MPPKMAKNKSAAILDASQSAKRPKSSLSSTSVKTSTPISSLPGRPVPKPRKTMNSFSSSDDFSSFDVKESNSDAPFRPAMDRFEEEEGKSQNQSSEECFNELRSDSGYTAGEEMMEEENLSPTHEAFYPFPLPPNLNEHEDLPINSVNYQIPQLILEPPTPAKPQSVNQTEVSSDVHQETSVDADAAATHEVDIAGPQANEAQIASTAVESQQGDSTAQAPELDSEAGVRAQAGVGATAQATSTSSVAAPHSSALVQLTPDAGTASQAAICDHLPLDHSNVEDDMRIDPVKIEQPDNRPAEAEVVADDEPLSSDTNALNAPSLSDKLPSDQAESLRSRSASVREASSNESNVSHTPPDEAPPSQPDLPIAPLLARTSSSQPESSEAPPPDIAIKDEMLQSLLSAIGKDNLSALGKIEPKAEDPNSANAETSGQDRDSSEVEEMDPDFWEVDKRPSQRKMEEHRRINASRDWDRECDELMGFEAAEHNRKQNEWQNQKSIRVRAEEIRELKREKGIFSPDDDHRSDDGSRDARGGRGGDRGGSGRGRGRGIGRGGFRVSQEFLGERGDPPPRFSYPYSADTQTEKFQSSFQPQSSNQQFGANFSSDALANLTSRISSQDAKAKLDALKAQISAQPDLFSSLLAKIATPGSASLAPSAPHSHYSNSIDVYSSSPYPQSTAPAQPGSYHQQQYSSAPSDPYSRNDRASLPPQSSLINDPYATNQERHRDPRHAYGNESSDFSSQDPYGRARSPISSGHHTALPRDLYHSSSQSLSPASQQPHPSLTQTSFYMDSNPHPYERHAVVNDHYRAPLPPAHSAPGNGWGATSLSTADAYSRQSLAGFPGPPPLPPTVPPAPQVTGYGARSTPSAGFGSPDATGYGGAMHVDPRGHRHAGDPRRGGGGGRGPRESRTKRMMS